LELATTLGSEVACGLTYRPVGSVTSDPGASTAAVLERLAARDAAAPSDELVLGEEIGAGGMGVVLRATQTSLARQVAVKRLRDATPALRACFLSEAQVLGRLEHPNIVPVHLLRSGPDGEPLCAMKLIEGVSWADHLERDRSDLAEHLRILIAVCQAVAFAHSRGIVHRDIKPANVMLGEFGAIYLTDWGLAVALDEGSAAGSAILHRAQIDGPAGTPAYMAPELAAGNGLQCDGRTDVYLLGACLHEILTGRRRHGGTTMRAILESALRSEPVVFDDDVPPELASLCNRATARDPAHRPSQVEEFRSAIAGYLEHHEARRLVADAARLGDELRQVVEAWDGSDEQSRRLHRLHAESRFAALYARELWPEAPQVAGQLRALAALMLDHALRTSDLALAERVLHEQDGGPEQRQRVEALRQNLAKRQAELEALREAARQRDWSLVAAPIGSAFIVSGVLGGLVALTTRTVLPAALRGTYGAPAWALVALLSGLCAFLLLRGRAVPNNLVSPRMFGLWAAVGLACVLDGAMSYARGLMAFEDASDECAFLAIGFAAMAMHTRRWLLVPAAAYLVGSVLMRPGAQNVEAFGSLWFVTMVGVGVALKLGARLDEDKNDAPSWRD
jgi:serine/threonine-protein kinase